MTLTEKGASTGDYVSEDVRRMHMENVVRAAMDGSPRALDEFVAELTPVMWHVARAAGLSESDAEDVVQTAWLRLLAHMDTIHTPAALKSWLITTTKREAWRVRAADRRLRLSVEEWLTSIPDPDAGAEEHTIIKDEHRELLAAFATLSQRCQELLRMVAFEQRPDYDLVAANLGVPRGSIGPTRGRCLKKLRAALQNEGDR
jgi:RNA polymerase sigma factor (sigma-70 family)